MARTGRISTQIQSWFRPVLMTWMMKPGLDGNGQDQEQHSNLREHKA